MESTKISTAIFHIGLQRYKTFNKLVVQTANRPLGKRAE